MKKIFSRMNFLYPLITFLAIILIWEFVVDIRNIPNYIMPSPSTIIEVFKSDYQNLHFHSYVTLYEAFMGLICAVFLSIVIGIVMDMLPIVKKCFYPIMLVTQMIPTITIAPLMIVWFGFGVLPKVLLVILTCFFPVLISLVDGIEGVDKEFLNLFKTMNASKLQTLIHLKLPMSMSKFFSGLKISATYAIMAATIAEWLGGTKGLGVYMVRAKSSYALDKVFASTILVVIFSLIFVGVVILLQNIAKKKIYRR